MHKYLYNTLVIIAIVTAMINFTSCKDDDEKEKVPAHFEYNDDNAEKGYDNNHPHFWSTSSTSNDDLVLIYSWNFDNGEYSSDSAYSPTYDFPGKYLVIFTVTTSEGISDNDTMTYTVNNINPELIEDPYLNNLCVNTDSGTYTKNWVLSSKSNSISTGPSAAIENGGTADYLNDPINEVDFLPENYFTETLGLESAYANSMSFTLNEYVYQNAGPEKEWLVNWYFANSEFGFNQKPGKDVCIDVTTGLDTAGYFRITEELDGVMFLEVNQKNFMLYYEGKPSKTKYQILALYDDLMVIRRLYFNENGLPAGYRYIRYVPVGKENNLPDRPISITNPPTEY